MNQSVPKGLRWFGLTDRGRKRANNEDSFLALQFDAQEVRYLGKVGAAETASADFVFAVSDGMGGALAGEFASRVTVEQVTRLLPKAFKQSAGGLASGYTEVLEQLFDNVHRALMYLGGSYEECAGMGATLSLGWFTPEWMYFGHIGDSRIYYLPARGGPLRQLTEDDTHVAWLRRNQRITENEARRHPMRNVLQKALGAGHQFIDPQVGAVGYESGDIFLLCTDGLIEGLYDNQLEEILRERADDSARALIEASIERSGADNLTAVVVEVV